MKIKLSENAYRVLENRYLHRDENRNIIETPEDLFYRVADNIAQASKKYNEDWEEDRTDFYEIMARLEFLPNSPTLMNAGNELQQLAACFVIPIEDSMEGIFDAVKYAALIHKSGGGTGFSFSRLRPKNDVVKTTGGVASGPISFMEVFDRATNTIKQGGKRRGANMGILSIDHPDILDFITCKENIEHLNNFNISVAVTEKFMQAAQDNEEYSLVNPHNGNVFKTLRAKEVFAKIVAMAHKNGEPGLIFIDRINAANPTPSLGQIESTNPCLTGDTLVATEAGFMRMDELYTHYRNGGLRLLTDNRVPAARAAATAGLSTSFSPAGVASNPLGQVYNNGEKEVFLLTTHDGYAIKGTADHLFLTDRGWQPLGELKPGDKVLVHTNIEHIKNSLTGVSISDFTARTGQNTVAAITPAGRETVYDISEPRTNSFIANGLVVHNCGEQPLLPFEACNLGSINLALMLKDSPQGPEVDYERLKQVTHIGVRFLDNVIDMNNYPLPQIKEVSQSNRKIGLGIMGWADLLIKLGLPYDSKAAVDLAEQVMSFIKKEAANASKELAASRGSFPNFNRSIFKKPRRNATLTTIAPTGSISIIAGCSSGIEPLFAVSYKRHVMDEVLSEVHPLLEEIAQKEGFYSPALMEKVKEVGNIKDLAEIPDRIKRLFVTAHNISPEWHIRAQAAFQKHIDNAVSKTVNFPQSATIEDIEQAFMLAYRLGCKGITIYRDGSRSAQVFTTGQAKDSDSKVASLRAKRPRPRVTIGTTTKTDIGCGKLYITINSDQHGICEVFTSTGRGGGCHSQSEAISRLVSLALRSEVPIQEIIHYLRGIRCAAALKRKGVPNTSCPDAIGRALQEYVEFEKMRKNQPPLPFYNGEEDALDTFAINGSPVCPDCGMELEHEGGCVVCRNCGYSKCG